MDDQGIEPRWTGGSPEAGELGDAYDRLVAVADDGALRLERRFSSRLFTIADGWVSLTDLDDDFHSMRIALRIASDGAITEAGGKMLRHPFETCSRALESLALIVGANIARPGAHNQIKERVPRTEGCLHLVDMLTVAFRAFRISKGHDMPSYRGEDTRGRMLTLMPNVRDTCVSFAVASPEDADPV